MARRRRIIAITYGPTVDLLLDVMRIAGLLLILALAVARMTKGLRGIM